NETDSPIQGRITEQQSTPSFSPWSLELASESDRRSSTGKEAPCLATLDSCLGDTAGHRSRAPFPNTDRPRASHDTTKRTDPGSTPRRRGAPAGCPQDSASCGPCNHSPARETHPTLLR